MIFHLKILPVIFTAFQLATNNHDQHHGILLVNASNGHAKNTAVTTRRLRDQGGAVAVDVEPIAPYADEPDIAVDDPSVASTGPIGVAESAVAESAVVDMIGSDDLTAQVIIPEEEAPSSEEAVGIGSDDLTAKEFIVADKEDKIIPKEDTRRRVQSIDVTTNPSNEPSTSTEPSTVPSTVPSTSTEPSSVPSTEPSSVPSTGPSDPEAAVPSISSEPSSAPSDRLRITQGVTAEDLINELIGIAGDVDIRNVVANPHLALCAGIFSNGDSLGTLFEKDEDGSPIVDGNGVLVPSTTNVIPDRGIILSTGDPRNFNFNDGDFESTEFFNNTETNETTPISVTGGDLDLRQAVTDAHNAGSVCKTQRGDQDDSRITIYDACVLEFEFRCRSNSEERTDQVAFNYIFGSEEYYEFVDRDFNDVFGFFMNSENIALVRNVPNTFNGNDFPNPTTDQVIVSINSVNQFRNPHLFNGNDPSTVGIIYPLIEADGFTNTLEAAANTNIGFNTMKLAVGDTCDNRLDSFVLLERNSFACREPTESPSTAPSLVPSTSLAPTRAPTTSPTTSPTTASPTTSPTTSPSSLPSLQPSVVDQIIVVEGSLSISVDVCVFDADDKAAFASAAILSIKQLVGCGDGELSSDNCVAEIANLCAEPMRRLKTSSFSSSRGLQEEIVQPDDWQLDFTVAATFTCERASCNSAIDAASNNAAAGSIVGPIQSSISSPDLLARLSDNMLATGNFAPDLLMCFAVWGRVDANPTLDVTPDTGFSALPYYPDWEFDSGTCLQGAENAPRYMQLDPESWLYADLAGCCQRYFGGWNENACNNVDGSGLWYVSHPLELCVTDCVVGTGQFCGGLAQDISDDLYNNPRSCCNTDLPWRFIEHCEAFSLQNTCYLGTMKYHRGDNEGWPIKSNVCVRDCDAVKSDDASCGGLVEDTYVELWDTVEECCSEHHEWMNPVLCAARSKVEPLDMWWPDKINSLCVHDMVTPTEELSIQVYNSTAVCCSQAINWLSVADCRARSGDTTILFATNMYYVDWGRERCVQDCEGDAPCVGLGEAQPWDQTYATASECCANLDWIPRQECFGVGVSVSRNLLGST